MNKFYLTLLPILLISCSIFAQNDCERANSRIVAAYSHVKKAYDSRNITDIKYFSVRSKESFENSKIDLETCGCKIAHKKALDAINLLTKVATVDIYEDARFFVKRTRDIAKEAMISIDECSYKSTNKVSVNESAAILTNNDQNMLDLQKQQLVLKQQQDALETKAEEIKLQLMSEQLKKNRALIERYKAIITTNIKTFNHSLSSMSCNAKTIAQTNTNIAVNLDNKSSKEISLFYKNKLQMITNEYLMLLSSCN